MASIMASTFALSRPSEKFGTHSTSVDIGQKNSWAAVGKAMFPSNAADEAAGKLCFVGITAESDLQREGRYILNLFGRARDGLRHGNHSKPLAHQKCAHPRHVTGAPR